MRRIVTEKREIYPVTYSDITSMSANSSTEVLMCSPIKTNSYFLGYSGSTRSEVNNTEIYSTICENAHRKYMTAGHDAIMLKIRKDGSNRYYLEKDYVAQLTENPTATLENIIMSNTYNGTTRYLGVNGTSVTSTTSQATAISDERYHWNLTFVSGRGFRVYNPSSSRYIRYANNAFSLNTTYSTLYLRSSGTTGNSIAGTSGNTDTNYLYMSSNTALARNQRTAQYWKIYGMSVSPTMSGTTSGRAPVWKINELPVTFSKSSPTSTANLVYGYGSNALVRIAQTSGSSTQYLNHGDSTVANLKYTTGGTSTQSSWLFFKKGSSYVPPTPPPIDEKIDVEWMQGKATGGTVNWDWITGTLDITFTTTNQKLLLWMDNGSTVGASAYYDSIRTYENGRETDVSKYSNVGFYCNNPKYSLTNGCSPYHQANTDINGVTHNSTVEFNTSSTVTESVTWPLRIVITGLHFA